MTGAYAIRHGIFVPRYACACRPNGLIPPSPPAEYRAKRRRVIVKALRALASYSGLLEYGRYRGHIDDLIHAFGTDAPFGMTSGLHALTGLDAPASGALSTLAAKAVAYWTFEEAAGGPYVDSTARGNTLTATASPTQQAGKIGNAIGTTNVNYATIADNDDVGTGVGISFTMIFWFYVGALGNQTLVYKSDNATHNEYFIQLDSLNKLEGFAGSSMAVHVATSATVTSINTWYMAVYEFDLADQKLHVQLNAGTYTASSGTLANLSRQTGQALVVGKGATTRRIDELALFHAALTSDERATMYNSGNGVTWGGF